MPLTDTECRNAAPAEKPRKLYDGGGLYLLVHPNGSKYWRVKYRVEGKERQLALGVYPTVGLKEAREKALRRFHTVLFVDKCEKSMEGASGVLV